LEVRYPLENTDLKRSIIKTGGLILTEYPPKTETTNWLFPIRNRIISGMSDGVVIVQSPEKSGAMITAKLTKDYEKPLFCLPPTDIFDEINGGNKKCIKNGAKMVLDVEDIISIYKDLDYTPKKIEPKNKIIKKFEEKTESKIPQNFKKLFIIINKEKRLDEILKESEYPPNKTLIMLTQMELENIIERTRDGYKRCY